MINHYKLSRTVELTTVASLTGIVLGGTNSIRAEEELGRDYNLGPGLNTEIMFITAGTSINIVSNLSFNIEYLQYNRWAHYKEYPIKEKRNFAIRSYIGITL
jgi:hypothetical protein